MNDNVMKPIIGEGAKGENPYRAACVVGDNAAHSLDSGADGNLTQQSIGSLLAMSAMPVPHLWVNPKLGSAIAVFGKTFASVEADTECFIHGTDIDNQPDVPRMLIFSTDKASQVGAGTISYTDIHDRLRNYDFTLDGTSPVMTLVAVKKIKSIRFTQKAEDPVSNMTITIVCGDGLGLLVPLTGCLPLAEEEGMTLYQSNNAAPLMGYKGTATGLELAERCPFFVIPDSDHIDDISRYMVGLPDSGELIPDGTISYSMIVFGSPGVTNNPNYLALNISEDVTL